MDELKKIAPELSKIEKKVPFRTPDHYFDDFSARLQARLAEENQKVSVHKSLFTRVFKPALGLAASFALVFMIVYWPVKSFMSGNLAKNESGPDIIELRYQSMMEGIDENSFYSLLEDQNKTVAFTDDELIGYLSANISEYEIFAEATYYN